MTDLEELRRRAEASEKVIAAVKQTLFAGGAAFEDGTPWDQAADETLSALHRIISTYGSTP